MMRMFTKQTLSAILLFAGLAAAVPALAAVLPDSCGSDGTTFSVKTKKDQPAPAAPEAGKAQIVFIENFAQNNGACIDCKVTTRVGVDGAWVGADHGNSYFAYGVPPGEHHLCADWQSALGRLKKKVGLASMDAEAGKTYYYQIRVRIPHKASFGAMQLELAPLDPDEGKYLAKIDPLATATAKK